MLSGDKLELAQVAIAAVDLGEENERVAELDRKIAEAKAAQDEARRRIAALNATEGG